MAHYDNLGRKLWVDDPNQGKTTFTYNAFSDLENELDANGDYQRYDYDLLGRVKQRYSSDGNATFTWDTRKRGLLSKTSASGVSKEFYFDSLARPSEVKTSIDGTVYSTKTAYNASHGFVKSITYPNGLKVAMDYNSRGYLTTEKNAASGYVYRKINEQDSLGNIKKASIANNKQQGEYLYSQRTGQMLMSLVTANGSNVHYLDYDNYDSYGNLRSQVNRAISSPQRDTYSYDNLQRLTRSAISVGNTTTYIDYGYDAVGNLKKKSDYSTNSNSAYAYQSGTNKVTSVALKVGGTATFGYDRKGNLIKRNNVTEFTYNVMNKPTVINRLGSRVSLSYDADWSRFKQVRTVDGKTITTHYIDKLYEVEKEGSTTTQTSYVSDVAVIVEGTNQKKIRFTHRDRLGSATTLMDHNNNVMAYRFYDPFGKPRMGDGSLMQSFGKSARLGNNLLDVDMSTRRGFTDHEHLDEVEIIHMNGRVYDYNVGRFLSVDPFVHGGSQGINPYSYLMNNPLAGTDPSGYSPENLTDLDMSQVESIQVTENGDMVVNTDNGSYSIESVGGKNVSGGYKGLHGLGLEMMDAGSQSSTAASNNFSILGQQSSQQAAELREDYFMDAEIEAAQQEAYAGVGISASNDDWVERGLKAMIAEGRIAAGGLQLTAGYGLCEITGCILGTGLIMQGAGNVGGGISDYLNIYGIESDFNYTQMLYEKIVPNYGREMFYAGEIITGIGALRASFEKVPVIIHYELGVTRATTAPRWRVDGTPIPALLNDGAQIGAASDALRKRNVEE